MGHKKKVFMHYIGLEKRLKFLNNKDNNNKYKNKVYKLCTNCKREYPIDIVYCPKCHEYLLPIPY